MRGVLCEGADGAGGLSYHGTEHSKCTRETQKKRQLWEADAGRMREGGGTEDHGVGFNSHWALEFMHSYFPFHFLLP